MAFEVKFKMLSLEVDCTNPRCLAAGSSNAVKLSRFFDKVIEKRYFLREGNQIPGFPDRKRFGGGTLKSLHYDWITLIVWKSELVVALCTASFLPCWLLMFQPFRRIILKCQPPASPFNGKLKGSDCVGEPNFVPSPLCSSPFCPFIDYVKALWKYETLSKGCSKWGDRVLRRKFTLPRTGRFLWVCNCPTLLAGGLIKYFKMYLCCITFLRGKVMLASPGSCAPNSLCHFQRSKRVLFHCVPSHHTQGCLRIAALVSLSSPLQEVQWLEEADS